MGGEGCRIEQSDIKPGPLQIQKNTSTSLHHLQLPTMPLFKRRAPVQHMHHHPSTMARLKAMFTRHAHPHHHTHGHPPAPVSTQARSAKRSLFRRTSGAQYPTTTTHTHRKSPLARRTGGAAQAAPIATGGHHQGRRSTLASLKAMFRPRRSHGHSHRTQYTSSSRNHFSSSRNSLSFHMK